MGYEVDLQNRYPPWYKPENLYPRGGNASFCNLDRTIGCILKSDGIDLSSIIRQDTKFSEDRRDYARFKNYGVRPEGGGNASLMMLSTANSRRRRGSAVAAVWLRMHVFPR